MCSRVDLQCGFYIQIPKDLVPHYCTLVSANPHSRPNPKDLLEEMRAHGGYLSDPMISIAVGAEELHVRVHQCFGIAAIKPYSKYVLNMLTLLNSPSLTDSLIRLWRLHNVKTSWRV